MIQSGSGGKIHWGSKMLWKDLAMDRKGLVFLFGLLLLSNIAFAGGRKEVSEKSVGPENSWSETFDIKNRSGKYNVYATATDKAGNEGIAGPFNVYIDEESDLPVIAITNPLPDMIVPGNLNIVGTCVDDDKVESVYLILDGDKDNPVLVEGTDFWSYYLDTTQLKEGRHTIEAYGVDNGNPNAYLNEGGEVDESKVKPKTGRSVKISWELNRYAPVVEIQNIPMGTMITGKQTLTGFVKDGNGIDSLQYSLDGGEHYTPLKLSKHKLSNPDEDGITAYWTFKLPLDTKKLPDGPTLIWFKGIDTGGSMSISSFLYYIDNSGPDMKIVTPVPGDSVNGIFTIAGYAKDANGLKSLIYKWGDKEERLPLIAGNPYWAIELDSRTVKSSRDFVIRAVDTMGNEASVSRTFMREDRGGKNSFNFVWVNQDGDKPVVELKYPVGEVDGEDGALFIRGLASDDDGVAAVFYSLDDGPEHRLESTGVFYTPIPGELSNGDHKVSVYAVDKFGVKGDTVTANFSSKGAAPSFSNEKYGEADFTNGMTINPEGEASYTIDVASTTGLKSVSYEWTWGLDGKIEKSIEGVDGSKNATVKIDFGGEEIPWGVSKLAITAVDKFDRVSSHGAIFNISDFTHTYSENAGIFFSDSVVSPDGALSVDENGNVTGYFAGGRITGVAVNPRNRSISASASGNSIILKCSVPTDKFTVRVTTSSGAIYESKPLYFPSQESAPSITLTNDNSLQTGAFNNFNTKDTISISGNVASVSTPTVRYRILAAKVLYDENGTVVGSQAVPAQKLAECATLPVRRGSFTLNLSADDFVDGISVIEFIATNSTGKLSTTAALVRKIQNAVSAELSDGIVAEPAPPATYWLHGDGDGMDYYGVTVYQGDLGMMFLHKKYSALPSGSSTLELNGTTVNVTKAATPANGRFISVDGLPYMSGMEIKAQKGGTIDSDPHSLVAKIISDSPVQSVMWTANGNPLPEGTIRDNGNGVYEAEVPLVNLPAGIVKINALINGSSNINGTVSVLRNHAVVDNSETIYWTSAGNVSYDAASKLYILNDGAPLIGFANVPGNLTASMVKTVRGLNVTTEGKLVKIVPSGDGTFSGVNVRVTNAEGGSWSSPAANLVVDTSSPILDVTSIKPMDYIKTQLVIAGTVRDGNGVKSLQYTVSETPSEEDWKDVRVASNGAFNEVVNLEDVSDGYMPVTIRATDLTGKVSLFNSALRKDSTPPEVTIMLPDPGSSVNGETLFVFKVKDDSYVDLIHFDGPYGKVSKDFFLRAADNLTNEDEPETKEPETSEPASDVATAETAESTESESGETEIASDAETSEESEGETPAPAAKTAAKEDAESKIPMAKLADRYSNTLTGPMPSAYLGQDGLPIDTTMKFTVSDMAGNTTVIDAFDFNIDPEGDLPVVEIHMPFENSVLTTEFDITGVMYDDDGMTSADGTMCKIYYKMDDGDYQILENPIGKSSFEIMVKPLSMLADNEHSITVYAEDINGVRGKEVTRNFNVSLSEPEGSVELPKLDEAVSGFVTLSGWAMDKNGINRVQISVDNGASYNEAVVVPGATREDKATWTYEFDTRVIQDGTHVVYLKIWDGYDITGLYTSLINVDNTAPELHLELPLDDSTIVSNLVISGQTTDNIGLSSLVMRITSLDGKNVPDDIAENDLYPDSIISQVFDISDLEDGTYNVEVTGKDDAGNIKSVSRNVHLKKDEQTTKVGLLYPLNGEYVQGEFNIYGVAESVEEKITEVEILVDGQKIPGFVSKVRDSGYFSFRLKNQIALDKKSFSEADAAKAEADAQARAERNAAKKLEIDAANEKKRAEIEAAKAAALEAGVEYDGPEFEPLVFEEEKPGAYEAGTFYLTEGTHTYQVVAKTDAGREVLSNVQTLIYSPYGPWVTLDNFAYGDFAVERPMLRGKAGYTLTEDEKAALKNKKLPLEEREELEKKRISRVYLSLDNGKTYTAVSRNDKGDWKYRIENQDVAEGYHFLLVKAEMANGEVAITRTIVQVDRTLPDVKLISPGVGGHYNQQLKFEGLSSDDVELEDVVLYLRKGDRSAYEVPKFIQGLYLDFNVWGATLWSAGLGLTAFDNAVKIQFSFGQFSQDQRNFFTNLIGKDVDTRFRYGGNAVISAKIIAQLGYIPFNYFFGHDFDWLSASISLGAEFAWFSESGALDKYGKPKSQILSAAIMQVEFPRMTFKDWSYFRTWAAYFEPQLWFIPSDVGVASPVLFNFAFGIRTSVF